MNGQMAWLSGFSTNGEKILHLRATPEQSWQPYTVSPYAIPDYLVPGGSKGWATFQKLLKEGWTLIPSEQARQSLFAVAQYAVSRY